MIELQGPHHYKSGYYDDGEFIEDDSKESKERYNIQLINDKKKEEYCRKHGISLEKIKYTKQDNSELKKDIINILEKHDYKLSY
jgi:hypothetical protein